MDKIKYIKIEDENGNLSDNIPIGADASNIDMENDINLQEQINILERQTDILNNKVDTAVSGTPIGVNGIEQMVDFSKIYVNSEDGYWYYYDTELSNWRQGGKYISNIDTVNEIGNFLTQISRLKNFHNLVEDDWEQGGISYQNNEVDANNRIRSRYIELFGTNTFTISLNSGFQAFIAYYDLNNNMLSYTDWYYNALRNFSVNSAVKIRIVLRKSDGTDITPSDYSNLTLYYDNISVKNILKTPLKDINNTDYSLLSDEIFRNNELFYCLNINSNDCPSEFKGQTCLVLTTQLRVIPNRPLYQQFILNNAVNKLFFRVFAVDIGTNNVTISRDWTLFGDTFNNNSPKNKWYVLGDSISSGYYSMKTADLGNLSPAITYEDGTCSVWDKTLNHNYWGYINKWYLKRDIKNLAIPGQGYFNKAKYN